MKTNNDNDMWSKLITPSALTDDSHLYSKGMFDETKEKEPEPMDPEIFNLIMNVYNKTIGSEIVPVYPKPMDSETDNDFKKPTKKRKR